MNIQIASAIPRLRGSKRTNGGGTLRDQGDSIVRLIQRRHEGPGWQVFTELANGTGARARRRADAVAMGMWPSRGYEIHGYECKISRGDVRKELQDVSKMDAVGKYCDFWWLAVSDLSILDGLIVPARWGVLTPRDRVLRVVRQATKTKAVPVDRPFVAAMLRSVTEHWVPRSKHQEVVNAQDQVVTEAVQKEREFGMDDTKRELERLRKQVVAFEQASGVQISNGWHMKEVGHAVAELVEIMRGSDSFLKKAESMERGAELHTEYATTSRRLARMVRDLVEKCQPPGVIPQEFREDPMEAFGLRDEIEPEGVAAAAAMPGSELRWAADHIGGGYGDVALSCHWHQAVTCQTRRRRWRDASRQGPEAPGLATAGKSRR
jgi:hypothetical protein